MIRDPNWPGPQSRLYGPVNRSNLPVISEEPEPSFITDGSGIRNPNHLDELYAGFEQQRLAQLYRSAGQYGSTPTVQPPLTGPPLPIPKLYPANPRSLYRSEVPAVCSFPPQYPTAVQPMGLQQHHFPVHRLGSPLGIFSPNEQFPELSLTALRRNPPSNQDACCLCCCAGDTTLIPGYNTAW